MKYANHIRYSAINPYEIVRAVNDKVLEVREMDAQLAEGQQPVIRVRIRKDGHFYSASGQRFRLADRPPYLRLFTC